MRIEVDWRRFESGLWECKEGDITSAYSADKKDNIRTPFQHGGKTYTTMNNHHCALGGRNISHCHELLPYVEGEHEKVPYSSEGQVVKWKGKQYRLGPKVEFIATERTVNEWQKHIRAMYQN